MSSSLSFEGEFPSLTLGGATDLRLCFISIFSSGKFKGSLSGDGVSGRPPLKSYYDFGRRLPRLFKFFGSYIV